MFNCKECSKPTGPKVKPIFRQTFRPTLHVNPDSGTVAPGVEIVSESKICPGCAGVEVKSKPEVDPVIYLGVVKTAWAHASKCKKFEGCVICQKAVAKIYPSIPLGALSLALQEPKHVNKFSMGTVLLDNLLTKANQPGLRAKADFAAGYVILKSYEQSGGGIG